MNHTRIYKLAAPLLLATTISLPAMAADWIEKVELTKDGIDLTPIVVSAGLNGYSGISTNVHAFKLSLYARATNGERIVGMKLGTFHNVLFWEGSGSKWHKTYNWRDVWSGTKRTVTIADTVAVPVSKITWHGSDPVTKCQLNLQQKVNSGLSVAQVLSQPWTVTAHAYFELDAVAARKNKAESGNVSMDNTTNQRDSLVYPVSVQCAASAVGGFKVSN